MKIKFNFIWILLLIPLVSDIANGIAKSGNIDSLNTSGLIKGIILIIIIYKLLKNKDNVGPIVIFYTLTLIMLLVHIIGNQIDFRTISQLIKIFFLFSLILYFRRLKEIRLNFNKFIFPFIVYGMIVVLTNYIGILTGFSNLIYNGRSFGFSAVFNSNGDVVTTISILFGYTLLQYLKENKLIYLLMSLLAWSNLLVMSTRVSIVAAFLIPLLIINADILLKGKSLKHYLRLISIMAIFFISLWYYYSNYFSQTPFLINKFYAVVNETSDYRSPRRIAKNAALEIFQERGTIENLFGQGVSSFEEDIGRKTGYKNSITKQLGKRVEIDWVDIAGYFGFPFMGLIFFLLLVAIWRNFRKFIIVKNTETFTMTLLSLFFWLNAIVNGHSIMTPLSAIIAAPLFSYAISNMRFRVKYLK